MTNEMKLLQELCKALGFKIETIIDRKERKECRAAAMQYNNPYQEFGRRIETKGATGMFDIDKNGMYTTYLINPVISYKLTRIEEGQVND